MKNSADIVSSKIILTSLQECINLCSTFARVTKYCINNYSILNLRSNCFRDQDNGNFSSIGFE